MEMEQVREKNRVMQHMLQRATVDALDFQSAAEQLHQLLGSSVYMINRQGRLLGYSDTVTVQLFSQQELQAHCCDEAHQAWMLSVRQPVYDQWYEQYYITLLPVMGQSDYLGWFLCASELEQLGQEAQLLADYGATLTAVMMLRAANRKAETEARKKTVVQLALEVLSYSEMEAVKYIFSEIEGNEGFLVASKLAEEYKLTRSVIVNALRKLESAGVIDARSLGMKGTYIKILNDYLYEELAAM